MALNLPIYVVVGSKPVSMVETADGGARLLGWDFTKGKLTRAAASWDDIVGLQAGPVKDTRQSESDWREITKQEFDAEIRRLQKRAR